MLTPWLWIGRTKVVRTHAETDGDPGGHRRLAAIEGWVYTRPCKAKSKDVLLRVPRYHYFSIQYREISMTMAHLPEIKKQKP